MYIRRLILVLSVLITLAGCQNIALFPEKNTNATKPTIIDPTQAAKRLETQGNYTGAAREYLRLASSVKEPQRQTYQLLAVNTLINGGLLEQAKTELTQVNPITTTLQMQIELAYARVALAENRLDEVNNRLSHITPDALPSNVRAQYYQLQAEILATQGNRIEAVRMLVQVDDLLEKDPFEGRNNQQNIWRTLSMISPQELGKLSLIQGDIFSGWVSLSQITQTTPSNQLAQSINTWRNSYPNHPANRYIVATLLRGGSNSVAGNQSNTTQNNNFSGQQIALLLPLTGNFKPQAEAIRDGIFAMLYNTTGQQPRINVYDTNASNVLQVYQQVTAKGDVSFIIGPLEKEAVKTLATSQSRLPVPTLALNYIDVPVNTANFYQFGLSPEDEASNVASRAWADGYRAAAVLYPETEWGGRVLNAFRMEWQKRGGQIATIEAYKNDFSAPVKRIATNPTVNMVFMAGFSQQLRQLRPYFDYYAATRLPIYSTSHVYTGAPNPQVDKDLNGVIFGDMPWIIAPDAQAQQLQTMLGNSMNDKTAQFKRLYAFGIDAYQLTQQVQALANQPYRQWQGQTGLLSLDATSSVRRQLVWARFVNGIPTNLQSGYNLQ
ncbi:putative lipoprotein [Beggiatoa alba B18LD]|uniref:Putative lipoprotein n=1 Tax=Beggiatoa alba B18LD TaxID=395493 RepID=I3CCZ0_9GAMM|nr:penicillin-binding protein activator [Beggiatoa alba]EIJ41483.1 putative lipoprotein [Beggiatoa alba B18LD]